MRFLLFISSFLFVLTGCLGAARSSMPEAERTFTYNLPHTKTQALAYQAAELWTAEAFTSGKTVVDLKQPETGIIILKPMIDWWAGGEGFGAQFWSSYSMKIINRDNATSISIVLHGSQPGYNTAIDEYPSEGQMEKIHAHFDALAASLQKALQ